MTSPALPKVLSERSPVTIGLIFFLISGIGSAGLVLAGAIWWASALQTKMDEVLRRMDSANVSQVSTQKEISDLEKRVIILEQQKKP